MTKSSQKTDAAQAIAAKPVINRETLLQAALSEADALGWDLMTMRDIALAAGCSLADVQAHFIDKFDVLVAFGRHIDHLTLQNLGQADDRLSPREKLFEGLMARFDVMQQYRGVISGLMSHAARDPAQMLFSVPELARSMGWLLEQAGIPADGLRGLARISGLTGVYLYALKTWKDDDSADLAKTMAAVDRGLNRAEKWAEKCNL